MIRMSFVKKTCYATDEAINTRLLNVWIYLDCEI